MQMRLSALGRYGEGMRVLMEMYLALNRISITSTTSFIHCITSVQTGSRQPKRVPKSRPAIAIGAIKRHCQDRPLSAASYLTATSLWLALSLPLPLSLSHSTSHTPLANGAGWCVFIVRCSPRHH